MGRRLLAATVALGASIFGAPGAHADLFTDDLTRCVVGAATDGDRTTLVRWIFAEAALNPALTSMANVTPAARDGLKRQAVGVLERITFTQCRPQAVAALKSAGADALKVAFQALGGIAGREMMTNPTVALDLGSGLIAVMDKDAWRKLGQDAGIGTGAMGLPIASPPKR